MKLFKILIVLFGLFLVEKGNAQSFSVGDTSCNYHLANKTFTTPTTYGLYSDFYYLDIDGDLNNDIGIRSQHFSCQVVPSGNCTGQWGNDITITLANNVMFVGSGPPTTTLCLYSVIKNLSLGSSLNNSLNWGVGAGQIIFSAGVGYYCGQQINPFYAGFRKILPGNDTIYGWIHIDSNFPGKVIDYAFSRTPIVTPAPVFTNSLTTICLGDSLNLVSNPTNGWFNGSGVSGNTFNSSVTGAGIHQVYCSNGCKNTDTLNITINPLPHVVFSNNLTSICSSDTLVLNASPTGGVFSGNGVSSNVFNSSVTGSGIHPVYYTFTNGYGCSKTATLNITVLPSNLSVVSSSMVSCAGQACTLTATGATNYTWSTGAISQSIVVNPTVTTNYTVTGNITGGCAGPVVYIQTVGNPTISVTAISSSTFSCPGYPVTLTASGAPNYTWSTGANTSSISVSPTASTSYTVVGALTAAGGCSNTASFTQAVGIPTVTAVSNPTLHCYGSTSVINANGSANYLWNTGSTAQNIVVSPTTTTTYSVIGTNPGGCGDTAYVTLAVTPNGTLNAVSNQSVICALDTALITINGGNGWIIEGGDIYVITSLSVVPVSPTVTTTFTISSPSPVSGCPSVGFVTVSVTPNGTLSATSNQNLICAGDTALLTISSGNGWTVSGGDIYIVTSLSVVPVSPTITTVFTISSPSPTGGCPFVGFVTQNVSACVGFQEINPATIPSFKIFPNPNNGEFEIKGTKEETIYITNELGQLFESKILNSQNNYFIKINNLASGMYFVGNISSKQKIVVIK